MWTFVDGEQPHENAFKCRWSDCFIGIRDFEQLDLHLEEHTKLALQYWQQGSKRDWPLKLQSSSAHLSSAYLQCGIYGCSSQCANADELRAHVRHHFHHAVAQFNGLKVLRQSLIQLMKYVNFKKCYLC